MKNLSKREIIKTAQDSIQMVREGQSDVMKELVEARREREFWSAKEKELMPFAVDTFEQSYTQGEKVNVDGVKIEKGTSPSKFSYDHFEEWEKLNDMEAQIKAEKKKIEDAMKNALKNDFITATQDGEEIPKAKVVSYGKTILKLSF